MSAWRIAVQALYDHGPMSAGRVELYLSGRSGSAALRDADYRGMVNTPGRGLRHAGMWTLTQRGIDLCEGRLTLAPGEPRVPGTRPAFRLVATWLSSLPRDIRINQGAEA
jgi:hypothetical protein